MNATNKQTNTHARTHARTHTHTHKVEKKKKENKDLTRCRPRKFLAMAVALLRMFCEKIHNCIYHHIFKQVFCKLAMQCGVPAVLCRLPNSRAWSIRPTSRTIAFLYPPLKTRKPRQPQQRERSRLVSSMSSFTKKPGPTSHVPHVPLSDLIISRILGYPLPIHLPGLPFVIYPRERIFISVCQEFQVFIELFYPRGLQSQITFTPAIHSF